MKKLLLFIPAILGIVLCFGFYADSVHQNLSDRLLRLHIVANSNSFEDQQAKLAVRDAIIESSRQRFSKVCNKDELKSELMKNQKEFEKIADDVLKDRGLSYTCKASFERVIIPRKEYDQIVLPEGNYDALVVRLGKAEGENWWCIVYPPLCFTESTCGELSEEAKQYLKSTLSPQSYNLISRDGFSIEYKLKLVEIFEKLKNKIKNE